jgi:aminoglycoside phosphotransferase (APT) family kinase protein
LLEDMVDILVRLQQASFARVKELLALGLPDWRAQPLIAAIIDVVDRTQDELTVDDRATLGAFVRELPARLDALADCGLPDSLVHGDFHSGNFRGDGRTLTLLDWGDSGVGHPLLDQPAFLAPIAERHREDVKTHWLRRWREAVAGCDPDRAAALLAPVTAARQAVIYRKFLDNIEPAEHPYHRADPARWLHRAALLARNGDSR